MNVIVITTCNLIFISSAIYWYSKCNRSWQIVFWPALLLKLLAGLALGLLYSYYYQEADTFTFFEDGVTLSTLGRTHFGEYLNFLWNGDQSYAVWEKLIEHQYRALFLAKVISLINLVTGDNYWITSLYFSLISFLCSWRLVLTLAEYFPKQKAAACFAFLFFPSVVFWSSGIVKEGLALSSLFFITHVFLNLWMKKRNSTLTYVLTILSLWILWQVKYYYLAVFAPVLCTSLLVKFIILPRLRMSKGAYEIVIWLAVFFLFVSLISLTRNNFHVGNLADVIVYNHNAFQKFSKPGGAIQYHNLRATGFSITMNAPWALFSGIFRPFIWEASNTFQFIFSIENLMILILFIVACKHCREVFQTSNRLLCLGVIVYSFLLCIFLALSTPNFGTLSRYRVGFLPFFIFLLCYKNSFIAYFSNFIQRKFTHLVR